MSVVVKICGLSTLETLDAALDAGADMVGFVFFPKSPRHITHDQARMLGAAVKGRASKVALAVDADDDQLSAIIEALAPDCLQLHGHETPERVLDVKKRFGLPVMKVLSTIPSCPFLEFTDSSWRSPAPPEYPEVIPINAILS